MTRWLQSFLAHWVRNLLLLLAVLCIVYYAWPRKSSISIVSDTEVLRVYVTDSGQEDWFLPIVHVCRRVTPKEESDTHFEKATLSLADVRFSQGYTLTFRGFSEGFVEVAISKHAGAADVFLEGFPQEPVKDKAVPSAAPADDACDADAVEISKGTLEMTPGTNLVIPFPTDDRPIMALRGVVDLGELPSDSGGLVLHRAQYEIRQRLLRFDILRLRGVLKPIVVATGDAMPGDKINFVRESFEGFVPPEPPAEGVIPSEPEASAEENARNLQDEIDAALETQVAATLVVSDVTSGPAFSVFLTTPHEYSALGVTRIGAELTTRSVSGMARLANDPAPAAVATFIGLFGALLATINAYMTPRRKSKRDNSQDASKD